MRTVLAAACALACACAPSASTPVADEGHTLDPSSGDFWSGTPANFPLEISLAVVSNVPGLCGRYGDIDACNTRAFTTGQIVKGVDGTFLTIGIIGTEPGDYDPASPSLGGKVLFNFAVTREGQETFVDRAVSGRVTFARLKPKVSASGSYDVQMESGNHLAGEFHVEFCTGLDDLATRIANANPQCSDNGAATTCDGSCTCGGKSRSAKCTRPNDTAEWTCQCDREGAGSSCTMPADAKSACGSTASCCDLFF